MQNLKKKQRKLCMLCSESIDESDYQDHVVFCSSEHTGKNIRHHRSSVSIDNDNDHRNFADTRNPSGYSVEVNIYF